MNAHTLPTPCLPEGGLDLRQELLDCQTHLVDQAMLRTNGDRVGAAKLLRTDPLSLERLKRFLSPAPAAVPVPARTPASELPTRTDLTRPRAPGKIDPGEGGRIDGGVMLISRHAIRRLNADGLTPKQIASQLGVNPYFVEKVLRCEAELAKCGSKPGQKRPPA